MMKAELFKEGDYLYHQNYGVGKVTYSSGGDRPDLTIAFEKKPQLIISAAHAEWAAIRLSPRGYRVFAYEKPGKAAKLLQEQPAEAVKLALYDFPEHQAKTIDLREYLSAYVSDWDKWWKPTQKLIKESPFIDSSRSKGQIYRLREEMLSLSEEAFTSFREALANAPSTKPMSFDDDRYERARQTLIAIDEGFALPEGQQEELQEFFQRVWRNDKNPKPLRIDALFRSLEWGWFDPESASEALIQLMPLETGMSALSRYAQNRFAEYAAAMERSEDIDQALLSGLIIPMEAGASVEAWIRVQLDKELDKKAVLILIDEIEKCIGLENSPAILTRAVERLNRLLDMAPSEEAFWTILPHRISSILQSLISLDDLRMRRDSADVFLQLMRTAGKLYSCRSLFEDGGFDKLKELLCSWGHPTDVKTAFLRGLGESDLPPAFREELLEAFSASVSTHKDAKLLVEASGIELASLVEFAERAAFESRVPPTGVAMFLAAVANKLEERELEELLPLMNRIVVLGDEEDEWVQKLNVFRAKIYRSAIQQILASGTIEAAAKPGLDPLLLYLYKEQFDSQTTKIRAELEKLEDLLAQSKKQIEVLEQKLNAQRGVVDELGQGISLRKEEERYKERLRLAGDLARSVAEMERHFSKQAQTKREIEAVIIRINGLLSGFGVEPMNKIGDEIPFDPQCCQLIAGLPPDTDQDEFRVVVQERGYRIRDPQGNMRILKPALVAPRSEDQ